ncbi:MAG: hypothetical protein JO320_04080, partial [Alphaproteobacteria bacterium]|nr:hypothetical protein [Alphaproteobacteria bacterium]
MIADADTEEFAERQLADTGWAAREARDFLKRLWPDDGSIAPVETVNGRITAQLRHQWGLNATLDPENEGKNRSDHRHHAIDALVVALTSRAFVKRLADWHKQRETGAHPPHFEAPWTGLFEGVKTRVAEVVVSHRVQRKLSGPLHEERPLGLTAEEPEKSGGLVLVRRKPVHELSNREVTQIRDGAIRNMMKARAPTEADRKALASRPLTLQDRNHPQGRPITKVRLLVERQPRAVMAVKSDGRTFAELGQSLRHLALYRTPEGKIVSRTKTRLQAIEHLRKFKTPVQRTLDDGSVLVFSLCAGEILARRLANGSVEHLVVRKVNQAGRVFYKPVVRADTPKPEVSFGP